MRSDSGFKLSHVCKTAPQRRRREAPNLIYCRLPLLPQQRLMIWSRNSSFAAAEPRLPSWEQEFSRFKSHAVTFLDTGPGDCVETFSHSFFQEKKIYMHRVCLASIPPLFLPRQKANFQTVIMEETGEAGETLPPTQTETKLPALGTWLRLRKKQLIDAPDPSHHISLTVQQGSQMSVRRSER